MVLPSLLFSGVMCRGIDIMFGETHGRLVGGTIREALDGETGRGKVAFANEKEADTWFNYLMRKAFMTVPPEYCKSVWLDIDDESYLRDGVEFPTPPGSESNASDVR